MDYTNFQVGEKFPLPILAAGDGGLFQIDTNGAMFILQLSHTDIIAIEAFRTGKMELALYEENDLLFFLYQIDGIFKTGWGDAPLSLHALKTNQRPILKNFTDAVLHLYLVDTRLQLLLAMRQIQLQKDFFSILQHHTKLQLEHPVTAAEHIQKIQTVWQHLTPEQMRKKASAVQAIQLDIPAPKSAH